MKKKLTELINQKRKQLKDKMKRLTKDLKQSSLGEFETREGGKDE